MSFVSLELPMAGYRRFGKIDLHNVLWPIVSEIIVLFGDLALDLRGPTERLFKWLDFKSLFML